MNGEKVLVVGIQDRYVGISRLIDTFVMDLNIKFGLFPEEETNKGILD